MDSNLNESIFRKKLIKSKSGLRIVLINQKYKSPFLLCEPFWVPDNEVFKKKIVCENFLKYCQHYLLSYCTPKTIQFRVELIALKKFLSISNCKYFLFLDHALHVL